MVSLTGGELNLLNGRYGISAPNKSVPVMKLIREHSPKSKDELVMLIKDHTRNVCGCGVISQGSVEDFGRNLYEAQISEWGRYKYTLQECINWEYNLFVVQSLKGDLIEKKAIQDLTNALKDKNIIGFDVVEANNYYDEEIRIDLEVKKGNETILGLQVKPSSYEFVRSNVKFMNTHRNSLVKFPVFYLYYEYSSEEFLNFSEIIDSIMDVCRKININ